MGNTRKAHTTNAILSESYTPKNEKEKFLVQAFLSLKTETDMGNFLRDLLTPAELQEFANRLGIVRSLAKGLSYQEIAEKTAVSTTTVSRVAHWLFSGCGGYHTVVRKLLKNK